MAMQHIIIGKLKDGCLLHYDEIFNEEKNCIKKSKRFFKKS
jgi:hypothetical protein